VGFIGIILIFKFKHNSFK